MAENHSASQIPADAATTNGSGNAGKIRASHLLVKHKDSRRPSSWKQVSLRQTESHRKARPSQLFSGRSSWSFMKPKGHVAWHISALPSCPATIITEYGSLALHSVRGVCFTRVSLFIKENKRDDFLTQRDRHKLPGHRKKL